MCQNIVPLFNFTVISNIDHFEKVSCLNMYRHLGVELYLLQSFILIAGSKNTVMSYPSLPHARCLSKWNEYFDILCSNVETTWGRTVGCTTIREETKEICETNIGIRSWIRNYFNVTGWGVTTNPCPDVYAVLDKLTLTLGHGWVFTAQINMDAITHPCHIIG